VFLPFLPHLFDRDGFVELEFEFAVADVGGDEAQGAVEADAEVAAEGGGVDAEAAAFRKHGERFGHSGAVHRFHRDKVTAAAEVKVRRIGLAHELPCDAVERQHVRFAEGHAQPRLGRLVRPAAKFFKISIHNDRSVLRNECIIDSTSYRGWQDIFLTPLLIKEGSYKTNRSRQCRRRAAGTSHPVDLKNDSADFSRQRAKIAVWRRSGAKTGANKFSYSLRSFFSSFGLEGLEKIESGNFLLNSMDS